MRPLLQIQNPYGIVFVDHLTDQRISPTHRTKALKRGGWSIGKINGKRVCWRGDSKPPHIDEDLLDEVCSS